MDIITLACGNGGEESHRLINDLFYKYFRNNELLKGNDSAILDTMSKRMAVTTDSFVIKPIFFKGGDIGKLSVCGTINDLAVSGAKPIYMTVAFIIEEGFLIKDLEKIVISISEEAKRNNILIVSGDTKVVERGSCDGIYINTTGIGIIPKGKGRLDYKNIKDGDKIIVSGTIGDHGISIMCDREELELDSEIKSDCASLYKLTEEILKCSNNIRVMRDPTRGGLATTLKEIVDSSGMSMRIKEDSIPIKDNVNNVCDMIGLDPLYIANEGKIICIVSKEDSNKVLKVMRSLEIGKDSTIIGEVIDDGARKLYYETLIGAERTLERVKGEQIPRIC